MRLDAVDLCLGLTAFRQSNKPRSRLKIPFTATHPRAINTSLEI